MRTFLSAAIQTTRQRPRTDVMNDPLFPTHVGFLWCFPHKMIETRSIADSVICVGRIDVAEINPCSL